MSKKVQLWILIVAMIAIGGGVSLFFTSNIVII
jgi:hypothetical protein